MKTGMGKQLRLLLDSSHYAFRTVSYIKHSDSPCKINIFLAFNILYHRTFGLLHENRCYIKGPYWNMLLRGKDMPLPHEMLMAGKIDETTR